ncbi:MAG TPA: hypothetical protein VFX28_23135, partial [Methylomirabilota bacterium]|nr:hypothetical protein [Methylomirabilota bacterium]
MSRAPDLAVPRLAFWGLVLAKVVGGWGLTWDIDWHVKIGRDTFWIAPHLMIYGSVVAGLLLGFGVLARDTWRARAGHAVPGPRVLGVHGSRGFHLSAWGL